MQSSFNRPGWNPMNAVGAALSSLGDQRQAWVDIVTCHCRAMYHLTQGEPQLAYGQVEAMVLPFTKVCSLSIFHVRFAVQCSGGF